MGKRKALPYRTSVVPRGIARDLCRICRGPGAHEGELRILHQPALQGRQQQPVFLQAVEIAQKHP